jgi:DeoR/GlpR family transcriptional regulator of sugar metabolism
LRSANVQGEEILHLALSTDLVSLEERSARLEVTASTVSRDLALLNS